jgi:hypothetical protein
MAGLNAVERKIGDGLAALGIEAHRADHAPREGSAVMYAEVPEGELFVNAHPHGVVGDANVVGERDQFSCGPFYVEVDGAVPARFASSDEFLVALEDALNYK